MTPADHVRAVNHHRRTTIRLADDYATALCSIRVAMRELVDAVAPLTSGEYQEAALRLERAERNADAARKALLWHAGGES